MYNVLSDWQVGRPTLFSMQAGQIRCHRKEKRRVVATENMDQRCHDSF